MAIVPPRIKAFWDRQHINPSGVVGRLVGERMVRQHKPETEWTLSLLDIAPGDRVLEIGFGAGRALELVGQQASHGYIAGIDVSRTMLSSARRRNATAVAAGRMLLLQGDVAFLPFAGEQFDKILSIHTFYFWPEPLQTMRQLFRLLRPGGKLVVTLSTGMIGPEGERTPAQFGSLHTSVEEQIIPGMHAMGFKTAYLAQGPDNRQYNSVAMVGTT
jgi:ubiquinone/menaquinone biosynthesis C-methylase UbiE